MDTSFASSTSELKSLYNLFTITEELLFSIPLNSDLVEKYMLLRESGLKKIGFPTQNSNLWALQKQAHDEVEQKHKSESLQIKELTEQLDQFRQSFKELYDSGQKILDFFKEATLNIASFLSKQVNFKQNRDHFQLSLLSNCNQMTNLLNSDFQQVKETFQSYLPEILQKSKSESIILSLQSELSESREKLKKSIQSVEEDLKSKYEKSLSDLKQKYSKELEDQKSLIKSLESRKNREIEEVHEKYERQLRLIEDEKTYTLENLSASIKNSHRKELKELELSFKAKENSLLEELDMATNSDTQVLKTLRENLEKLQIKVQDLREVLRAVSERSTALFQKYVFRDEIELEFHDRKEEICQISDSKAWKQYAELLTQLDFMGLAFKKLGNDNEWLVEQIDELSKAEQAKKINCFDDRVIFESRGKEMKYEQVISTLSANESVIKDFQDARSKLLKQFADAKRIN